MPYELVRELRGRWGGDRTFKMCIAESGGTVFEVLLRLDDGAPPFPAGVRSLRPDPDGPFFDWARSSAWHLPCCWGALKWNLPSWLNSFKESAGVLVLGEEVLCVRLKNEIDNATYEWEQDMATV